jgi:hypothetical protein
MIPMNNSNTTIRWNRTDFTDGASEVLTLCQLEGDYVIQVTSGPNVGDDFVGLYDLDGDGIQLGNFSWEVATDAPSELLAEVEQNWESGTTCVSRI